jgi:XTP/dITP diphosphohydrolase/tetrapyrrole methylase family protein/MazG family protein
MFAEAVWKQIEKRRLPVAGAADAERISQLGAELDEHELGRRLFELTAAARAKGLDPEGALRLHATGVMRQVERNVAAAPAE